MALCIGGILDDTVFGKKYDDWKYLYLQLIKNDFEKKIIITLNTFTIGIAVYNLLWPISS